MAKAAGILSHEGHGALIVLERETGLEEIAESGVMLHSDLSHELLTTIFAPRTELHDGAVIIRGGDVLAAAALLPLTEMTLSERFGTRHRAALGITEDTDAIAVVVSEESGQMSVVERARIVRVPDRGAARAGARRAPRGADRAGGPRPRPARHGGPPAHRPASDPARPGDRRRRRTPAADAGGAPVAASRPPRRAGAPSSRRPAPVDAAPETAPEAAPEREDDATHRVPEVPRDEAGDTAAAAVADR